MILSIMYMYFAGTGSLEFDPWLLGAATVCDAIIISSIGNALTEGGELINMEVRK